MNRLNKLISIGEVIVVRKKWRPNREDSTILGRSFVALSGGGLSSEGDDTAIYGHWFVTQYNRQAEPTFIDGKWIAKVDTRKFYQKELPKLLKDGLEISNQLLRSALNDWVVESYNNQQIDALNRLQANDRILNLLRISQNA